MTHTNEVKNPATGADSERTLFEAKTLEQFPAATFDKFPSGNYRVGWVQDQWIGWQAARAAAKVGANVAAESIDTQQFRNLLARFKRSMGAPANAEHRETLVKLINEHVELAIAAALPASIKE